MALTITRHFRSIHTAEMKPHLDAGLSPGNAGDVFAVGTMYTLKATATLPAKTNAELIWYHTDEGIRRSNLVGAPLSVATCAAAAFVAVMGHDGCDAAIESTIGTMSSDSDLSREFFALHFECGILVATNRAVRTQYHPEQPHILLTRNQAIFDRNVRLIVETTASAHERYSLDRRVRSYLGSVLAGPPGRSGTPQGFQAALPGPETASTG